MALSVADVRDIFISLWPSGRLYDWHNPLSSISRFIDGCAETLKTFGYDVVDRLRREINPARCVDNVPAWEEALGLTSSYTAQHGSVDQRRANVIGKLREFGAFTLGNAQAILAVLLGYVDASRLVMLEVDRGAMRAAHMYTNNQPQSGTSYVSSSVYVPDGGTVSSAGVQLTVQLPAPSTSPLFFLIGSPGGKGHTWTPDELGPPRTEYHLQTRSLVGVPCNGSWMLIVGTASGSGTVALSSWSLFVEGAGPSGLGGDIVDWGVYADPALVGSNGVPPDFDAVRTAIARIQHAHTSGYLIRSLSAVPDDPLSLPDAVLPG